MLNEVNASLFGKEKASKLNILLNVIIALIIIALVTEIAVSITYSGIYVIGPSMNNTLNGAVEADYIDENGNNWKVASTDGDYVYVNKYAEPTYGDIVVVSRAGETNIIKRVIALAGDTVRLYMGSLEIKYSQNSVRYTGVDNFVSVKEEYVSKDNNDPYRWRNTFPRDEKGNYDANGYFVEDGKFFLLGDNRDVSEDSRSSGSFPLSSLEGVVTEWSKKNKSFLTAIHKYFTFDLPSFFGIDNRIKRRV